MSVRTVLVAGGGPAGMAAALGFARRGVGVTLAEVDPQWRAAGMGLTLLGPTLRALDEIGTAEAYAAAGFPQDHADFYDARGELSSVVPFPRVADERLPAAVCITRPAFHRVLSRATLDAGVDVRLGVAAETLDLRDYDLIVGADGLHSKMRALAFEDVPAPQFTGQAVWRTLVPRPPELDVYHMFYGRKAKVGLVPVSERDLYVFAVQNVRDRSRPPSANRARLMSELLDADHDLIARVAAAIREAPDVTYNPTEWMLVPPPWNRGHVVLIGDAAHTTTPHLAFGAGIAIEDAIVLCELVDSHLPLEQALERYVHYRYERCRLVVENSVQLSAWEQQPGNPNADPVRLTRESWAALVQPLMEEATR